MEVFKDEPSSVKVPLHEKIKNTSYFTCPVLREGKAIVHRVPYNCHECDETIRFPWNHKLENPKDQPHFQIVENLFLKMFLVI